jgi:hypothetical protein
MSKHNKVNPGQYTQAGRLTPDDAAREMVKQREAGSPRQVEGGDYSERAKPQATTKDNSASEEDEAEDSGEEKADEEDA